ncbi:hypothetical protein CROQUDRAFT_656707 [Cronartium quercuum f. sp. fusiforme G11]|uniref:Uncharacterized protein n=1 Tax=Cronartium quercuum f. sp. fusiforme G11 TaxID=708437 RepID=A0A9P6NMK0_9BASI|nr:hypothetical protein CROQUDRAFT_656707 [Cronartium quercuum f. sp. fusiforme G11]
MPSPFSRLSRTYERSFKRNPSLTLAITNGCLKCLGDFLAQLLPALLKGHPFTFDGHRSLRFLLFGFIHGPCVGKWHEFLENRIPLTLSVGGLRTTALNQIEAEKITSSPDHSKLSFKLETRNKVRNRAQSISDESLRHSIAVGTISSNHIISSSSQPSKCKRIWGVSKRLILDQLIMAPLFVFVFISFTGWLEGLSINEIKSRLDSLYWHILTANWKIWPIIQIINFNFMPLHYRVPWQSTCGIVWTVFLSLSTHPSPSPSITTTTIPTTSIITNTVSKILSKKPNDENRISSSSDSSDRLTGTGKIQKIRQAIISDNNNNTRN